MKCKFNQNVNNIMYSRSFKRFLIRDVQTLVREKKAGRDGLAVWTGPGLSRAAHTRVENGESTVRGEVIGRETGSRAVIGRSVGQSPCRVRREWGGPGRGSPLSVRAFRSAASGWGQFRTLTSHLLLFIEVLRWFFKTFSHWLVTSSIVSVYWLIEILGIFNSQEQKTYFKL
jgi:hypothetical protein